MYWIFSQFDSSIAYFYITNKQVSNGILSETKINISNLHDLQKSICNKNSADLYTYMYAPLEDFLISLGHCFIFLIHVSTIALGWPDFTNDSIICTLEHFDKMVFFSIQKQKLQEKKMRERERKLSVVRTMSCIEQSALEYTGI